jgi:hypothetical protein
MGEGVGGKVQGARIQVNPGLTPNRKGAKAQRRKEVPKNYDKNY